MNNLRNEIAEIVYKARFTMNNEYIGAVAWIECLEAADLIIELLARAGLLGENLDEAS